MLIKNLKLKNTCFYLFIRSLLSYFIHIRFFVMYFFRIESYSYPYLYLNYATMILTVHLKEIRDRLASRVSLRLCWLD